MAISENDIIIENEDVHILNGDFDIKDARDQNIKHILIAQPGNYVVSPSAGAMVYKFQNDNINDFREVLAVIAQSLKKDGYNYPDFYNQTQREEEIKLTIDAQRIAIPNRETI